MQDPLIDANGLTKIGRKQSNINYLHVSDGSSTRNPGFGFWKCMIWEMGLRQVTGFLMIFLSDFCDLGKKLTKNVVKNQG